MTSLNVYILPHSIAAIILFTIGIYSLRYSNISMAVPFVLLLFPSCHTGLSPVDLAWDWVWQSENPGHVNRKSTGQEP